MKFEVNTGSTDGSKIWVEITGEGQSFGIETTGKSEEDCIRAAIELLFTKLKGENPFSNYILIGENEEL